MDFGSIPLFQAMARRMSWLNERQSVLAENVANANTPGYSPEDLKPLGFKELVAGGPGKHLAMTRTSADQLPGTVPEGGFRADPDPSSERTLSGNAVDLEGEMLKVSQTASDYQLITNLYKQQIGMLKTALGRPGG